MNLESCDFSHESVQTERLYLREMKESDLNDLCKIMMDDETMYAYEGAFTLQETKEWLNHQLDRYNKNGFGLWAVILKETNEMIGQCGLTIQNWKNQEVLEIGYLFQKKYWHNGYAIESAKACKEYAFTVLTAPEVCSIIRSTNTSSIKVALKNEMKKDDSWIKHYRGVDMPHYKYTVKNKGKEN